MIRRREKNRRPGAVLVIGGGIAGIQAALDLAESGQKVYLLEASPAIGGNMARLDKTFPTNDCSMCILSPKIVQCGRHLNIETITWAELEKLREENGRFTATIRKRARFVDASKCTGCGECFEACPITVQSEFDTEIGSRKVIFRPYPQAFPNVPVIDKHGKSPCRVGCPAGININAYVALTAARRFDEAFDVILETVPLAGVLGRVCDHPCEDKCHMASFGEPVAICALKRFLSDWRRVRGKDKTPLNKKEQNLAKVAVIGSGPAGLTAAWELARKGYRPTIFEALSRAGGMLAWGIPDYRLPPEVLDEEIKDILREGINLILNSPFGIRVTLDGLKKEGFKAVVLAIGAQAGTRLGVEGEEGKGVTDSIAFLHQVKTDQKFPVGRKVTVIGGGNSAIDAARTALRLGAGEVTIIYRRTRAEMPAISAEVEAAEAEGIQIHYLAAPVRIVRRNGNVSAMECVRMQLGEPDESGRFRPEPIPGSEFIIQTDMVISAIGQKVVLPEDRGLKALKTTRWGTIEAREVDAVTGIEGVFAIGDAVNGPRSVIEAIAEGHKAAAAVDAYLGRTPFVPLPRVSSEEISQDLPRPDYRRSAIPRQKQSELPPGERRRSFAEVEGGLTEEQVVAEANRCLHCAVCSECMACFKVCKAAAILHDQQDVVEKVDVGAVVVAPGFEEYHSRLNYDYGYSRYADVVSSIQFERILSASGPFNGHVRRPSDGKEPKKIAFLQCVGSRDISCRNGYCSSVCCMYAIKEAVIAKEHLHGVDVTVFFMDIRAFGKDFDKYYERAKNDYGVRFVRARVSDVNEAKGDGQLVVKYAPEAGSIAEDQFDMVVLSVGMEPSDSFRELTRNLGVRLDEYGFVWTDAMRPLCTSRAGVFAAGAASGPKDIPETVIQASAAACEAGRLLRAARGSLTVERTFPPERDVAGEPPRIGVFICHCGINIGGVVNVPVVVEHARSLPNVVYAEENLYTCSQDTQNRIRDLIRKHNLNRVVVASCSPRTHESLFQQTLREAGLNPYLFEMANIRDQCSWIHMNEPEAATVKAKSLTAMAVAKVALAESLVIAELDVTPSALVIGAGLAGMTAAMAVADQGFNVTLVEREKQLGGNLARLYYTFDEPDIRSYLKRLGEIVRRHKRITVRAGTELAQVDGFVGNFQSTLKSGKKRFKLKHGVVIVATGGNEHKPDEYHYGRDKRVLTQLQLEALLARKDGKFRAKSVVMIQCVGSREEGHMYCSRVCCAMAVKNALKIKELLTGTQVYILYRDMRTYSFAEEYYQRARDKGIVFVRYEPDGKPQVSNKRGLSVTVRDMLLECEIVLRPDLLVLSSRIDPDGSNGAIGQILKVPLNADRFFLEAHVKLRPVEFATEGVYVAGLAHGPKPIAETIAQAEAAAAKACTVLCKKKYEAEPIIACVNEDLCDGCGICSPVCDYGALEVITRRDAQGVERKMVRVTEALCKGCGGCVAACPSGAMEQKGFKNKQILAMIDAALES